MFFIFRIHLLPEIPTSAISYISKEPRQTQFFHGLGGPLPNNWAHLIHIGYILQSLVRTFDQCQLPQTMVRCKGSRPALRNQSCWERFQSAPLSGSTRSEEVGVKPVRRSRTGQQGVNRRPKTRRLL